MQAVAPPQQIITIEPAQPDKVYVPAYNPSVVYGTWPYPNTVHFEILIAAVKSIRTVGSGVRGRSG